MQNSNFKSIRLVLATLLASATLSCSTDQEAKQDVKSDSFPQAVTTKIPRTNEPELELLHKQLVSVEKNSSVFNTFVKAGLNKRQVFQLVNEAAPHFDLAKVKTESVFEFYWSKEPVKSLQQIRYEISGTQILKAKFNGEIQGWDFEIETKKVSSQIKTFYSTIESNLWQSATLAGIPPEVISIMADTFAWQIDFAREVKAGDKYRIAVEQLLVDGEPYGWGRIHSAEYMRGKEVFAAVSYDDPERGVAFYAPDGSSLKKMFLKSPVSFSKISSKFSGKRFHPILKINRAHKGIDYAAATGTPVHSVGDGTVTFVGVQNGSGNVVRVKHNNTYETSYHHLNGFASGVKKGSRISQGEVVGYVGSTGLATGPHLHFEFAENGKQVDPLGIKFPASEPINPKHLADFKAKTAQALALLPSWEKKTEILTFNVPVDFSAQQNTTN